MGHQNSKSSNVLPLGFRATGLSAGIKKNGKPDLGILISEPPAKIFGTFTQNRFKAAPVVLCQKAVRAGKRVSHVLVNSGNANACTGDRGLADAESLCAILATAAGARGQVIPCSTGVIGEYLPLSKMEAGFERLLAEAKPEGFPDFAKAIMTTDTREKRFQKSLQLSTGVCGLSGVTKGAGMIHPNMATMLAFIATDLELPDSYQAVFRRLVEHSFNSISVDGDMSTNDTALLLSNGACGLTYEQLSSEDRHSFDLALEELCLDLAKSIAADGEGATKLVEIRIKGASDSAQAQMAARAIANSPLVKTAFFGNDPNWGRVVAALGAQPILVKPEKLTVKFCGVPVFQEGTAQVMDEAAMRQKMAASHVYLDLDLGLGEGKWTFWTCDFTFDYVKINAEYRT